MQIFSIMRPFHRQSVVSLCKRLVVKAFLWALRERRLSSYNPLLRAAMTVKPKDFALL